MYIISSSFSHLLRSLGLKKQKPGQLSFLKGNPAIRLGPMAFRPHLAMGLAFSYRFVAVEIKKARHKM
jgi:hypothetical protein